MSARGKHIRLAEGLARQGHVAPAVEACYEALRLDASGPLVHALLGDLLLRDAFYDEAITASTRAIELDAECIPAYLTLGLAYDGRSGMWDRSILVWHELAELAPHLVIAHVQLGEALAAVGFESEAIEAWNQALAVEPHEARAMYNLAVVALKREGMATALPGFRRAGELDSSQDDFFYALSGAGLAGGAGARTPQDGEPRQDRLLTALSLARSGDYFGAADAIRDLLGDTPSDAGALALAGYLYLKQEAVNEAMAVALRALAISTKTPAAVYVLGAAFAKHPGLKDNASRVFAALARAVPMHSMPHVLLAESLLGLQRYGEARRAYLRAVALEPTLPRARFGLAAALLAQSEHALAHYHMRRAAYHDTRSRAEFMRLYDAYAEGRG